MASLVPPRVTGVIIATGFFILVTIPKPSAGAVLSKGAKDNVDIGEKFNLTQIVNQEDKCLLDPVSRLDLLDGVLSTLNEEEKDLLQQIWQLGEDLGLNVITTYQEDVCYTKGCLEAARDILEAMDTSAKPCEDFYQYTCGRWIENNGVPPESVWRNRITLARDKVNNFTQELLSGEKNDTDAWPINQAKQFYKDCIDIEATEAKGLQPLRDIINSEFWGWQWFTSQGPFDWVTAVAKVLRLTDTSVLIDADVILDAKDTSRSVIYIDQQDYGIAWSILNTPKDYPDIMEAYKQYMIDVAREYYKGETDVDFGAAADAIIALEVTLAGGKTKGDEEDLYNPYSLPEFQKFTDDISGFTISWKTYLDEFFISSGIKITENEDIVLRDPEYYKRVLPILKETDPSTIADYILWRLIKKLLPSTTEAMKDIIFNFENVRTGAKKRKSTEVTCANEALSAFGMAIGVKYIETEFDKDAISEVNQLVENVIDSFKNLVEKEEWMDDRTKQKAIEKADALRIFTGYPPWLKNKMAVETYYQDLELAQSHFQNKLNVYLYKKNKELKALRESTDWNEWMDVPTTVNAFYYRYRNSITFPAGILQSPFFGVTRPKSINYGFIGSFIGHEVSHAFDKASSQYNKDGNLEIWWDATTLQEFERRTKCMIDQYSKVFVKRANKNINGELTIGENIADNGGILASLLSYQKYIKENGEEKKLPGLEDKSSDQLFFIGYGNIWCESITNEGLVNQILTDSHSPAEYRVNVVVSNSMEFAQAFDCPVDENGMNPPDKCKVW